MTILKWDNPKYFYQPIGNEDDSLLWLKPERVIDAKRLRYDSPKKGEIYFTRNFGWAEALVDWGTPIKRLILDPPVDDKTEAVDDWLIA